MRRAGSASPEAISAERTRSRASETALSGKPTMAKAGKPGATCTCTSTARASIPSKATVETRWTMLPSALREASGRRRTWGIIYLTPHTPTYSSKPAEGDDLPEAGAPDLLVVGESRDPQEAIGNMAGLRVEQGFGWGPSQGDAGLGPNAPERYCSIVLKSEVPARSRGDHLNEQVAHADAGEVSIRGVGILLVRRVWELRADPCGGTFPDCSKHYRDNRRS